MKHFVNCVLLALSTFLAPCQTRADENFPYITIIKAWRHGETDANKLHLLAGGGPDNHLTVLNEEGKQQAEKLADVVFQAGKLDIIYTSDLSRSVETAQAILKAFEKNGDDAIELRRSMQLREILHGRFHLYHRNIRKKLATVRLQKMLTADENQLTPDSELKDKYRFWKIHPMASNDEIIPEDIINVEEYLKNDEARPETQYQLWLRIYQEFIRIAKENPGCTVGISTHGAAMATLRDGLSNPASFYLPPHYIGKEIRKDGQVIIPVNNKLQNCALLHFKYDSREGKLEFIY